jgi:acyl-CoA thioesterase FadM
MIFILVASFFKPPITEEENAKNSLTLRVLPNDIDINRHMNNGRYLTICDLSRVDLFLRTGLAQIMLKERWMPVISEHTMIYKKSLNLFEKYEVQMELVGWDEKAFHMVHTFLVGDRIAAQGTSKGVIVGKKGVVEPMLVMDKVIQRLDRKLNSD